MIRITIEGQPIPKGRPKFGNGKVYTPVNTRIYEDLVGWQARAQIGSRPMINGDICASFEFRRKGNDRADLDNMIKSVLDGLQGVAFDNDNQVMKIRAGVTYGCDNPGVDVTLQKIGVST